MSGFAQRTLPQGVQLGKISREVFDALARFTSFPWPVMQAQCRREELDPTALTKSDVERLLPHLATAVARFTSPEKGEQVAEALRAIVNAS
ncbi:hypothetical protein [Sandaracinus amylolyticus]|uniref:Uncharacterized protein n=1 Tax=Sandaracinus amylolyticus TaxID=927083 RepID=A0A0F6W9P4_9BACT|nr:hypothetical protein [Sandaracinus amylolyticus]AKF10961.1 hypothetical protein DB32_008110 [Sandaracinus amylolyticus]